MASRTSDGADRRSALHRIAGLAAIPVGLPLLARVGMPLISPAQAGEAGQAVQPNQGSLVHIPGATAPTSLFAEWMDPSRATINDAFHIAATKTSLERAPADASRYEAKLFTFPNGSLRTLTFKKGGPVLHMIAMETEIFVLSGTATLMPLPGHRGKPVKVAAGDALFLPSGYLKDPKASEDFVILQAFVGWTVREAKSAIVTAKQAPASDVVQWEADGKQVRATKPEEIRKAPKTASRQSIKRYEFEGNSFRVDTLKGGKTNTTANNRMDVLMYIAKGRLRRKEGDQMLDLVAGDCMREKQGHVGYFEPLEDSVFIATDAPLNPGMLPPDSVA